MPEEKTKINIKTEWANGWSYEHYIDNAQEWRWRVFDDKGEVQGSSDEGWKEFNDMNLNFAKIVLCGWIDDEESSLTKIINDLQKENEKLRTTIKRFEKAVNDR